MKSILPGLKSSVPAIVMTAGCVPMVSPDAPPHVRCGGSCLMAIGLILIDLQSGKKLGYSTKIAEVVRTLPGMAEADEATVIGLLTWAASVSLGGGEMLNMSENGVTAAGMLKVGYNAISYPLSTAFDFHRSREMIERHLGKEISIQYLDDSGNKKKTTPISTSRLLQQISLLSGAAGVTAYGTMLDVAAIQYTGLMFAVSNGMNITNLVRTPLSEWTRAKLQECGVTSAKPEATEKAPAPPLPDPARVADALKGVLQEAGVDGTKQPPRER